MISGHLGLLTSTLTPSHPRFYCELVPMKLSVVMPVYNERATLREVIARVLAVPLELELICVDDGSRDGSPIKAVDLLNEPQTGADFVH